MKKTSLLLAVSCCVCAAPAFAGFQWTPPAGTTAPAASVQAAPVGTVTASDLLTPLPDAMPAPAAPVYSKDSATPVPPKNLSAFEAPALARVDKNDVSATVLNTKAPVAAKSYEQEIPQKHAIRPIRIDTRPTFGTAAPAAAVAEPVVIVPQAQQQAAAPAKPAVKQNVAPALATQTLPVQTTERKKDESPFVPAGQATSDVPAPAMTWIAPVEQKPVDLPTAPVLPTIDAATPAGSLDGTAVVDGFGRDIPLPLAVRQIVPAGYGLAFDRNVNTKLTVTWEGGRAWLQVLNSALGAKGLRADVSGQLVRIRRNTQIMGANEVTTSTETSAVDSAVALGAQASPKSLPTNTAGPAAQAEPTDAQEMALMESPVMDEPSAAPVAVVAAAQPNQMASQTPSAQQDLANVMPAAGDAAATAPIESPVASTLAATQTWTAQRGMTLRDTLTNWAQQTGVQLYWASGYDYPLATDVALQGTFDQAVQTLLKGFTSSHPKPTGRLHPNLPNGPAVLVIETTDQPK